MDSNTLKKRRKLRSKNQPEVKPEAFAGSFAEMHERILTLKRNIIAIESAEQNRAAVEDVVSGLAIAERALCRLVCAEDAIVLQHGP